MLLAADATGAVDLSLFAQYGAVGVIATLGVWFARGAYRREVDRADRLEAEKGKLADAIIDRVLPVLNAATRACEESAEVLNGIQRERERERERAEIEARIRGSA